MSHLRSILNRLLQLIPVLIGISIISFLLQRLAPGDPVRLLVGDRASPETIAAVRQQYGLDLPLPLQFLRYMTNVLQGDLGLSVRFQRPVAELLGQFVGPTLFLAAYVVVITVPPTLLLAVTAARRPGGLTDQVIRLLGILGLTIPVFWLGIMMARLFGAKLGWFPVSGYGEGFTGHLHHLFLPALSIAIWLIPVLTQSLRSALIEKSTSDFITAARAQGASEREVFWRHMLPNAVLPTFNLLGVMVALIIGSTVIVETVYAVPGLGRLMITSLIGRDYYVVQGLTLIFALATVFITLSVDIISTFIDPRVEL
ncbi:ABC transporter permease [Nordella sp. HKS 07]|uniref:ABC transporter permease n=1 Tax=Nordella sp. HKS 07 TaxID=2712222 RepID=UPI0013E0F4A8|nr:ABC transporter permease [Nordella sp. HKS 07]QIG46997.1 ABC transporter permease [Nordella sp. HKS 07]